LYSVKEGLPEQAAMNEFLVAVLNTTHPYNWLVEHPHVQVLSFANAAANALRHPMQISSLGLKIPEIIMSG
jgi:hypothetical protein